MGFNESYYNREVNALIDSCIRELRRHNCEEEPTNDYKFNKSLLNYIDLSPFKKLDKMIVDMIYENEIITVANAGTAANVFLFMSFLSSEGLINNFKEEEDRYNEDGIKYAKRERVCYPFITLLFANKCDFYMLGSRLFPRIIMGGLEDLKNLIIKLQREYKNWITLPDNMSLEKFCDSLYLSFVPHPESLDSIASPYFNRKTGKYLEIESKYPSHELSLMKGKRENYIQWFKDNIEALHAEVSVDPSLGMW